MHRESRLDAPESAPQSDDDEEEEREETSCDGERDDDISSIQDGPNHNEQRDDHKQRQATKLLSCMLCDKSSRTFEFLSPLIRHLKTHGKILCSNCFSNFDTENAKDHHNCVKACANIQCRRSRRITDPPTNDCKHIKTTQDQWKALYGAIFPQSTPPDIPDVPESRSGAGENTIASPKPNSRHTPIFSHPLHIAPRTSTLLYDSQNSTPGPSSSKGLSPTPESTLAQMKSTQAGSLVESGTSRRYRCVFCSTHDNRHPTQQCAWLREYPSQLRQHHFHTSHSGGPFGCCSKCFVTGCQRLDEVTGRVELKRFRNKEDVTAHEVGCVRRICIDEGCSNYDTVPSQQRPCFHETKPSRRQVWRMWYRRAHNLGRNEHVPEADGSPTIAETHSLLSAPASLSRPASDASSVRSRARHLSTASSNPATSPAVSQVNSFDPSSSRLLNSDAFQLGLETLARDLLRRVREGNFSWTQTLSQLYDSTMPAAMRSRERLAETEPILSGRIHSIQIMIDLCRSVMTDRSRRTADTWFDLRSAAGVALFEVLAPEAPPGWLSQTSLNPGSFHNFTASAQGQTQIANIGNMFDTSQNWNVTPYNYPTVLDSSDVDDDVRNIMQVQTSKDSYARTIDPRFLYAGIRAGQEADAQSAASAPVGDSGVYTAENSSIASYTSGRPGTRRPSMPDNCYGTV